MDPLEIKKVLLEVQFWPLHCGKSVATLKLICPVLDLRTKKKESESVPSWILPAATGDSPV